MTNDEQKQTVASPIEPVVMWINPDDELPLLGELVLVRKKPTGNIIMLDNITEDGSWLNNSYVNDHKKHDVLAWMRIPKLHKDT